MHSVVIPTFGVWAELWCFLASGAKDYLFVVLDSSGTYLTHDMFGSPMDSNSVGLGHRASRACLLVTRAEAA